MGELKEFLEFIEQKIAIQDAKISFLEFKQKNLAFNNKGGKLNVKKN